VASESRDLALHQRVRWGKPRLSRPHPAEPNSSSMTADADGSHEEGPVVSSAARGRPAPVTPYLERLQDVCQGPNAPVRKTGCLVDSQGLQPFPSPVYA
jgi:hypothetical protein